MNNPQLVHKSSPNVGIDKRKLRAIVVKRLEKNNFLIEHSMKEAKPTIQDVLFSINDFATAVNENFNKINERFEQVYQHFKKIDQRFEEIGQRFKKIDQRFEKIDQRFDIIDQRFANIESKMVTKEYLDDKLAELKGDLTILIRKEDTKLVTVVETLAVKKVFSAHDKNRILSLEPFPSPSP